MTSPSPLFALALCSGVATLGCGLLVARRWHKPGADWYVVAAIGASVWALGYAAGLVAFDASIRWIFEVPIWLGHGIVPVAFFVFVLRYTGRTERLAPSRHVLLWTIPILTVLVVLTNDVHELMWSNYEIIPTAGAATVSYEKGPWLYVHKLYSYAIVGAAAVALVQMLAARDSLYTAQAAALTAVTVPLLAASVVWVLGVGPYPQVSGTPLLFGSIFATVAVTLFRSTFFDSAPAARRIGKRRVIDSFDDGVLLLDDTDRIVDANPAALCDLERERDAVVGRSTAAILPELASDVSPGRFTTRLETATGYRSYELAISPITDGRGGHLGHSIVFHDVTDETQRRQRLTVLNRVLRHNLRNDLNVVQMYAAELEASVEAPNDELASVIVEQSTELAAVGEKARRIERTLDVPDGAPVRVALRPLLDSLVERFAGADGTSFAVGVDADDLELRTYPTLLETVLEDAIENAVVHGGPRPSVRIDARERADGRGIDVTITDDGPGIPDSELAPIEAGTETPLEHGSGLGLWLISWGTAQLGGSASIARLEEGGTRVWIRLPTRLESGSGEPERERGRRQGRDSTADPNSSSTADSTVRTDA